MNELRFCQRHQTKPNPKLFSCRFAFTYYEDIRLSRVNPVSGPTLSSGTAVSVYGENFLNSTTLMCRFGRTGTPGMFVSGNDVICLSPPLHPDSGGLGYYSLFEIYNRYADPIHGSRKLFPEAHYYPLYSSKLVGVEVSNNDQDYSDAGITFLYQQDVVVESVMHNRGPASGGSPIFVTGENFVNSTMLSCRIGHSVVRATYLTSGALLCFTPPKSTVGDGFGGNLNLGEVILRNKNFPHSNSYRSRPSYSPNPNNLGEVYVEVSNNGVDFSFDRKLFTYSEIVGAGKYLPMGEVDDSSLLNCPRGSFCHGSSNGNFTLCPRGTYQPMKGQSDCLRCPIGYMCPESGLPVPRICPAGFVCDVTGIERAEQLCPEGHYCLEGTATSATTCGHPVPSSELFPSLTVAERTSTMRKGRKGEGNEFILGARNSACWNNGTSDFGLQASELPARIWAERHLLPLSQEAEFAPIRGRYCLDDTCMKFDDQDDLSVTDTNFDYSSAGE